MSASHRTTIVPGHRAEARAGALGTALDRLSHLPPKAGAVIRTLVVRAVGLARRLLTTRQVFAIVLLLLLLLYLFVLVVEPTGAGRGGR
jgi:uncharacterized membrane protein YkvI